MDFQYTTINGQVYYLHQGVTKLGNPKYYLAMHRKGMLLASMPAGFEVYEDPNGTVVLRRIPPQLITDDEMAIVTRGMQQCSSQPNFRFDLNRKNLTIHTWKDIDASKLAKLWHLGLAEELLLEAELRDVKSHYGPEMRFVLVDKKERTFSPQRLIYKGASRAWKRIGDTDTLDVLAPRYLRQLTMESYFQM